MNNLQTSIADQYNELMMIKPSNGSAVPVDDREQIAKNTEEFRKQVRQLHLLQGGKKDGV